MKKPSGFVTNSPCAAESLSKRCKGIRGYCSRPEGGKHEPCSGKVASAAQVYPRGLCRAVLKGVTEQVRTDGLFIQGCYVIQVKYDEHEVLKNIYGHAQGYSGKYNK